MNGFSPDAGVYILGIAFRTTFLVGESSLLLQNCRFKFATSWSPSQLIHAYSEWGIDRLIEEDRYSYSNVIDLL